MPPLPKRKFSHGRKRRKLLGKGVKGLRWIKCPHCRAEKIPHRICGECGKY